MVQGTPTAPVSIGSRVHWRPGPFVRRLSMVGRRREERHQHGTHGHCSPRILSQGAVSGAKSKPVELRQARRRRQHGCWGHVMVAPLWVACRANLGTLLRTCDAVGACLAVPNSPHYHEALAVGDTFGPVMSTKACRRS